MEKRLPTLEEIYHEAFLPFAVDYMSGYDSYYWRHYTNNLTVRFSAYGCTICRTLQELCFAARVKYDNISFDYDCRSKNIIDMKNDSYNYVKDYLSSLVVRRSPTEPWCIDICAALYKLIADQQ